MNKNDVIALSQELLKSDKYKKLSDYVSNSEETLHVYCENRETSCYNVFVITHKFYECNIESNLKISSFDVCFKIKGNINEKHKEKCILQPYKNIENILTDHLDCLIKIMNFEKEIISKRKSILTKPYID